MESFKSFLAEKILSIGFNPEHESHRERYRQQFHDMIHNSYKAAGGYGGLPSGSKEESDSIHQDITHAHIKATKRGDRITSVSLYKMKHGRKGIASATDGTPQGKADYLKTGMEDHLQKRAWGEKSGAPEHIATKMGVPAVPASHAEKLTGKKVEIHPDGIHYTRNIGGHPHTKAIYGHPKY